MDIISPILTNIIILSSLLILYLTVKTFKFLNKFLNIGQAVNKFPMDKKHWFWGHLHQLPGADEEGLTYFQYLVDKYPRSYGFWAINWFKPSVQVTHADTVKDILKTAEPKSMTMGTYKYATDWIGDGLLLSSGERWFRSRRLLTPVFHFDNLHKFLRVKNQCVDVFLEKLSKYAEQGESIEIMSNLSSLTVDIILKCAFSYENNIQQMGEKHPYMKACQELDDLLVLRSFKPWQHFDFIYKFSSDYRKFKKNCKYVHEISDELIKKRKEELKCLDENSSKKNDFLNVLLTARDEDGNGLTDHEIRAEVNTLLFAGHETTATSTSWVLYSLAQNPHCLRLCLEEIDEIFSRKTNSDDDITHDDLKKLFYLTCCIKESLRMNTTVFSIERELTKPMSIDGHMCPVGTVISPMLQQLHHNETIWTDHSKFDPERFFPENFIKMDPFAFAPFSAGPRNCIGQHFAINEMKIILTKILHKFTISLDPERVVRRKIGMVLKTEDGMFLKVLKR